MVNYRRNWLPGGTFFFTVTLADRRSSRLVTYLGFLQEAFRTVRRQHLFVIDAIVVLLDHLHAVWTLPPNDADFPGRGKAIKRHFTHALLIGTN